MPINVTIHGKTGAKPKNSILKWNKFNKREFNENYIRTSKFASPVCRLQYAHNLMHGRAIEEKEAVDVCICEGQFYRWNSCQ